MRSATQTPNESLISLMSEILKSNDPYFILGIHKKATEEEISKAYKTKLMQFHPDKHIDETIKKLAEDVTKKINDARTKAIHYLAHPEEKDENKDKVDQKEFDRVYTFNRLIMNQAISRALDFDKTFLVLWKSVASHAYGITMLWVRSALANQQSANLERIDKALKNTVTLSDVYNLAQGLMPYLEHDNLMEQFAWHQQKTLWHADSPLKEFNIETDENISWNFAPDKLLQLVKDVSERYAGIPIILHDLAFEKDRHGFVGIYFQQGHYYFFNPNHLLIDHQTGELKALSWDEVKQEILNALYRSRDTINEKNANEHSTISLITARPDYLKIESTQSSHTNKPISMIKQYLLAQFQQGLMDAKSVLQSIYDGQQSDDLLLQFVTQKPDMFSDELIKHTLDLAIQKENIAFALAVCQLDSKWGCYFINDYIKQGKSLAKLSSILPYFTATGIHLLQLADPTILKNGSSWFDHLEKEAKSCDELDRLLQLGVRLTEKQLSVYVNKLAYKLKTLGNELTHEMLFSDIDKDKTKKQAYLCTIERIKKRISEQQEWLNVLIKHKYTLAQMDGFSRYHSLYLALIQAELIDAAHDYVIKNMIRLSAKDDESYTALNRLTKDEKWAEVKFLLEHGGTFTTGAKIKAKAVPAFAAWLKNINELKSLYSDDEKKKLLALDYAEGDFLAAAIHHNNIDMINYALANGFRNKLLENPIHYLYQLGDEEAAKYITQQLPTHYLKINDKRKHTTPLTTQTIANMTLLPSPIKTSSAAKKPASLMGLAKDKMDQTLKQLSLGLLRKIEVTNNLVYYTTNNPLTLLLCEHFTPVFVENIYQHYQNYLFDQNKMTVPDLSACINQITQLFNLMDTHRYFRLNHDLSRQYFKYLSEHKHFDETTRINQWNDLTNLKALVGLKIEYDESNHVKSFIWIDDIALIELNGFLVNTDTLLTMPKNDRDHFLWQTLFQLYKLKAVLEKTLGAQFDAQHELINDKSIGQLMMHTYDRYRKALSPSVMSIPLFMPSNPSNFFLPKHPDKMQKDNMEEKKHTIS